VKKKLLFAALLGIFAVLSVSAQNKADNFLGTWKMTQMKGYDKASTIQSITLTVTQAGGDFNIERTIQGVYEKKDYSYTRINAYKIDGSSSTNVIPGQLAFFGVYNSYMKFTGDNKLMLRYNLQGDSNFINSPGYGATEYWKLSNDGKNLFVESRGRYGSTKTTYSKQ